jgi:hypothetical protein
MPEKLLIAIHGIGDQVRCETIQTVAQQLCTYCGIPSDMPLGRFNAGVGFKTGLIRKPGDDAPALSAFLLDSPQDPPLPAGIGFAEIYWADIPRGAAKDRYTLEESRKWIKTIVGRLEARESARKCQRPARHTDYVLARTVLQELCDTISILQNLLFFAHKAKLFDFSLKNLLTDYLGDVQVVTDYPSIRVRIVGLFHDIMQRIHTRFPDAELFVIAHSEGTVIAFLGILRALSARSSTAARPYAGAQAGWIEQLRGFMTIGSPIDKHLLLWPELWAQLKNSNGWQAPHKIKWRNYYDFGDPVGFRLDRARDWLRTNGWKGSFDFDRATADFGFTRYLFPGKAHNDYWHDDGVFGHFFQTVVQPPEPKWQKEAKTYSTPRTRAWAQLVSPMMPFVLAGALLVFGAYLLYKSVIGSCMPFTEGIGSSARNVTAISLLLAGTTAVVRIPRLTASWAWRAGGVVFFVACMLAFPIICTESAKDRLGAILVTHTRPPVGDSLIRHLNEIAEWVPKQLHIWGTTVGFLGVLVLGVVGVAIISMLRPMWGAKPLVALGTVIVLGFVVARLSGQATLDRFNEARYLLGAQGLTAEELDDTAIDAVARYASDPNREQAEFRSYVDAAARERGRVSAQRGRVSVTRRSAAIQDVAMGPIWPLILAGAAFLYLWWLAALVFDLAVVWHYYIRESAILDRLATATGNA